MTTIRVFATLILSSEMHRGCGWSGRLEGEAPGSPNIYMFRQGCHHCQVIISEQGGLSPSLSLTWDPCNAARTAKVNRGTS